MRKMGTVRVTDRQGRILETYPVMGETEPDGIRRSEEIYGDVVPRYMQQGLLTCYIFMDWDEVICRK